MIMRAAEARGMGRVGWLSPNVVSALGVVVHLGLVVLQLMQSRNAPCDGCGKYKKRWESFCGECKVDKANGTGVEVQEKEKGRGCEEKAQLVDVV